jgi:hypothetical protein
VTYSIQVLEIYNRPREVFMQRKFGILLLMIWAILSVDGFAGDARRNASFTQKRSATQILPSSTVITVPAQSQVNSASDVWLQAANRSMKRVGFQQGLFAIPAGAIAVAPNQPPVQPGNTKGIINALCDVPLYVLGCGFSANAAVITCDTNGDGIPELQIPLKDVRVVNGNLIHAIIPALSPQLPGTAFPLACCGDTASLTLIKHVGAGDDNIFGEYTLKATCPIELGMRAPVILSAVASSGDCAIGHNLQLPGSCFILPDGKPNVTSVFAIEKGNPSNVIDVTRFVILSDHLIDAYFEFGAASAGKTFLIYASGPSGTSRNMTSLPQGAPAGCPTGNEQGREVTFTCASLAPPPVDPAPVSFAVVSGCRAERNAAGVFSLTISGRHFKEGATVVISGVTPKKLKFKDADLDEPGFFRTIIAKGRICNTNALPGPIVITNPNEIPGIAFQCNTSCQTAVSAQDESVDTNQDTPQPPDVALISGCRLESTDAGVLRLVITGSNIGLNATVKINGTTFAKVKFQEPEPFTPFKFTRVVVKGKVCRELPGAIVITNTSFNGIPSVPFYYNQDCPN